MIFGKVRKSVLSFADIEAYGVQRARRTGACYKAGDLPTDSHQKECSYRRPTASSGRWHLDLAGSGLHDSSDAGAGTDLRGRPSTRAVRLPPQAKRQQAVVEVEGHEPPIFSRTSGPTLPHWMAMMSGTPARAPRPLKMAASTRLRLPPFGTWKAYTPGYGTPRPDARCQEIPAIHAAVTPRPSSEWRGRQPGPRRHEQAT
jgi:hypothetical protein